MTRVCEHTDAICREGCQPGEACRRAKIAAFDEGNKFARDDIAREKQRRDAERG
jgi:hypothetical protein